MEHDDRAFSSAVKARLQESVVWRQGRAGFIGCVVAFSMICVILGLDAADVGGSGTKYVGVLTATPFIAAAFAAPLYVGAIGVIAMLGAYQYGMYRNIENTEAQWVRIVAIVLATMLAMVVAYVRAKRDKRIVRLTRVAEAAQQAILHPVPSKTSHIRCNVRYHSAATDARIGGDLYEVLDTRFGTRVLIGDVRGKGLQAVRLASAVLGAFRHIAYDADDLYDIAFELDKTVARAGGTEDFVTCVIAQVDIDTNFDFVNCGHPSPLLIDDSRARELVSQPASPPLGLGVIDNRRSVVIGDRAQLLLYTDGLIEARNNDGAFFPATEVVPRLLNPRSSDQGLADVERAVLAHTGGRLDDDVALLVLTGRSGRTHAEDGTRPAVVAQ